MFLDKFIKGIRVGFATNSSSSHSIIFGYQPHEIPSDRSQWGEEGSYGWDHFVLSSPEEKKRYLLKNLARRVEDSVPFTYSKLATKLEGDLGKSLFEFYDLEPDEGYGVDHQSVMTFPTDTLGRVDIGFFEALMEAIVNDDSIAILGGNDNEDSSSFDLEGNTDKLDFKPGSQGQVGTGDFMNGGTVIKNGDSWTIFHTSSGYKERLNFQGQDVTYSEVPELVDLKITDYCDYGCKFCYQGSTVEGQHADKNDVNSIIYALGATNKVFEVAIGGGEPTQHPDFTDFLQSIKAYRMVPNFTTFSLAKWVKDPKIVKAVNMCCGGFAVSCLTPASLKLVKEWNQTNSVKATLQIPCGGYNRKVIENALVFAAENLIAVTLLGYKTTHRGKDFPSHKYDWMLDFIKNDDRLKWLRFGADTLFVEQFKEQIQKLGVDKRFVVGEEGAFSCYVDACKGTLHKCSFITDDPGISIFKPSTYAPSVKNCTLKEELVKHFPFAGKEVVSG